MAWAANRIEVNLTQEKIDFINDANHKQLQYWKNIVLAGKNENERKELTDLAPLRVFLARKDFIKNDTTINAKELIFYLKNNYLPYEEEQGAFIEDIPSLNFCSIKRLFLKFFAKFIQIVESLFNENASLQSCNFIKKRLQHRCSPVDIAKFLRTPVLKNIRERLFERIPTWINNITSNIWSEEDIFSKAKQKNHPKTQLSEKKLAFS